MRNRPLTALLLLLVVSNSATALICRDVYRSSAGLTHVLENKLNPFDIARNLRKEGRNNEADQLLDETAHSLISEPMKKQKDLGGGVNDSAQVYLKNGLRGVFKPIQSDRPNLITREVVAYRISRLFKLDIVPPTVIRLIDGSSGSFQLFMKTTDRLEKGERNGKKVVLMDGNVFDVDGKLSGRRLRIFDWLINNHDRGSNAGNYLVSKVDGVIIGIDNSVSFVGHDKEARKDKVPYYQKQFLNDRDFYLKLKSVSRDQISDALLGLNPKRITEFLERYDRLMADFESVLAAP